MDIRFSFHSAFRCQRPHSCDGLNGSRDLPLDDPLSGLRICFFSSDNSECHRRTRHFKVTCRQKRLRLPWLSRGGHSRHASCLLLDSLTTQVKKCRRRLESGGRESPPARTPPARCPERSHATTPQGGIDARPYRPPKIRPRLYHRGCPGPYRSCLGGRARTRGGTQPRRPRRPQQGLHDAGRAPSRPRASTPCAPQVRDLAVTFDELTGVTRTLSSHTGYLTDGTKASASAMDTARLSSPTISRSSASRRKISPVTK